jgi:hypothetical protein
LARERGESDWPFLAAIVAVFAASWLLVGPRANVPVIDDWVYAWSVEHLLETGQLRVLDISAFYPIAQLLWGALFARLAGFSFVVLRFSTVVLSGVGCCAVYFTLRELDCRRRTSLIGALALALDPVYFALSFTFMTEVPFISLSTLAMYCYIRAIRRGQPAAVWAGCACALAAFLIRPIGIVLPLALVPSLAWSRDSRLRRTASVWPLAVTLAAMGALEIGLPRMLGPLDWAAIREDYLRWWFTVPFRSYLTWNVEVLFVSVFPLLPLLLAYACRRRRAIETAVVAIVLALACRAALGRFVSPLPNGQTWSLHDVAARMMLDGDVALSAWALRIVPLVRALGALALAAFALIAVRGVRNGLWRGATLVVVSLALLQLACINALWLYNDRYYLVLAPMLAILVAQAIDADDRALWMASALLVVWAAIGISGTRDMLAFNDAAARAARELEATGIPPWDIDAGYAVNGWRLYAHPEHLPPGANRRYEVPFVTGNRPTTYSITNSPLPGSEIIRVVPLDRASWQSTHALYIVRRTILSHSAP